MPLVTLIGEKLAKENDEFIYLGPQNDCKNCKLKTVCFNLKPGMCYKIIKVRDKRHSCSVHDGNAAVIEVKELPIITAIDKKISEGDITKIEKKECNNIGCKNYRLCFGIRMQQDKQYKVEKIYESMECPEGYKLQKAELSD